MAIRRELGEADNVDNWASRMTQIMDEMLNRSYVQYRDSRTWQPPTNVYETPGAYHVCMELAGMSKEDIEVVCPDEKRVAVSGHRPMPRPGESGELCLHVIEVDEGAFAREIELPEPVDVDRVSADYAEGFLWITLPKKTTT